MKLGPKGQLSVPEVMRRQLGWLPDTEVTLEADGNVLHVRPVERARGTGDRAIAALRGKGNRRYTTDELMRMTRGE